MADVLNVPSTEDFTAYVGLVSKQGDHLRPLVAWTGKECSDTDGLDGLLSLVKPYVPEAAQFFGGKLEQCRTGMDLIKEKITTVDKEFRSQDSGRAADMTKLFPDGPGSFPDISSIPGAASLGNFQDEDVTLKTPNPPKEISEGTVGHLMSMKFGGGFGNNELWTADKIYKMVTGNSLIDQLFKPLVGDWDRLMYLHDAYDTLGDGCYTVAGTLRKGSWKIGGEWQGQTATAFDFYLFRWTMGIGGIGDGAKSAAKIFKDSYEVIVNLVKLAVTKIDALIEDGIKKLAVEAAKMIAGDIAIETVGLGPEDPVADAVAAVWTADRMIKIYKIVRSIVSVVTEIVNIYSQIQEAAQKIPDEINSLYHSVVDGSVPTIGSLIDDVEQRGFEFEKNSGWNPLLGASRIAMLPTT